MRVHVAILTALAEERSAVWSALNTVKSHTFSFEGDKARRYGIIDLPIASHGQIRVAVCEPTSAGPINGAIGASNMLLDLSPVLTILTGIAGCMRKPGDDFALGDVAIAEDLYDYAHGKYQNGETAPEWKPYRCDNKLVKAIRGWLPEWQPRDHTGGIAENVARAPKAIIGTFLSGNTVLADREKREEFRKRTPNRRLIAIEMEAAGIKPVLEDEHDHNSFLLIKAFSDYAGDDKQDGAVDKDRWHEYACRTAATFTVDVLKNCLGPLLDSYRNPPDHYSQFKRKGTKSFECFVESFPRAKGFFSDTAGKVFSSALEEIKQMAIAANWNPSLSESEPSVYRAKIGRGHQFLLRASEVFGKANRVFAFSVDNVSTFWTAEQMKDLVKNYIASQAGGGRPNENVVRTFVFSSPDEAHRYARRLDYHAERFPNTFVCSREHYEMLLETEMTTDKSAVSSWLGRDESEGRDFATLCYKDEISKQESHFFACLDKGDLTVRAFTNSHVLDGLKLSAIERVGEEFIKECEAPGEIRHPFSQPVLRWCPGFWKKHGEWAAALTQMFELRTAVVYHLTGFNVAVGEGNRDFRRALVKMKNDIQTHGLGRRSLASKHKIRAIGLARRIDYDDTQPHDGITGGRLHYTTDAVPNDVVIMTFAEQSELQAFLGDDEHTLLRMRLFLEFAKTNQKLATVFAKHRVIEAEDVRKLGANRKKIYEEIEKAAALWRVDFLDDEMINELVESSPLPF